MTINIEAIRDVLAVDCKDIKELQEKVKSLESKLKILNSSILIDGKRMFDIEKDA